MGAFAPAVIYPAGNGTTDVAVGDLDGDGDPDLVATNSVDGTIGVFINAGDGSFGAQRTYALGPQDDTIQVITSVVLADVDGDGKLDVISTSQASLDVASVEVFLNTGAGELAAARSIPGPARPHALATGDFDGDGRPDLAITTENGTVVVMLGDCR